MKINQLLLGGTVVMFALSLSFTSCRKPNSSKDEDTSGAEDNALADRSFEDIGQISNEASNGGVGSFKMDGGSEGLLSLCATVSHDTVLKKITVDFGSANCLCKDGRYRRGKIYVSYTAGFHNKGYWDSLSNISITTSPTDDYFVNDHQVKGSKSVTNNGRNSAHHLNWTVVVNGTIVKANNQGTITWTANRNLEWLAGAITPFNPSDDIYGVTGTASGTSAKGVDFSVTITKQLIRKVGCPHFTEGTFDFTPGSKPVRHVDFSYSQAPDPAGSCDDLASVVVNGNTHIVHMK